MVLALFLACATCAAAPDDPVLVPAKLQEFVVERGRREPGPGGEAVLSDATLASPVDVAGDLAIDLTFAQALADARAVVLQVGDLEVGLDSGQVTIGRGGARLVAAAAPGAARAVRVVVRSGAAEVLVNDASVAFATSPTPFSGGKLTLAAASARIDRLVVTRRPWFDDVRIDPIGSTDRASLIGLALDRFELANPPPTRIDPVYELRVKRTANDAGGDERGLRVSFCGVRPDAATVPLVEQALAFAQIKPRIAVRLLQGEKFEKGPLIEGEGPAVVSAMPAYAECDVLVGVLGLPPTASVYDADSGELLDRTWVGGPPARALATRIPDACKGLRFVLIVPGRAPLERTVRLTRP